MPEGLKRHMTRRKSGPDVFHGKDAMRRASSHSLVCDTSPLHSPLSALHSSHPAPSPLAIVPLCSCPSAALFVAECGHPTPQTSPSCLDPAQCSRCRTPRDGFLCSPLLPLPRPPRHASPFLLPHRVLQLTLDTTEDDRVDLLELKRRVEDDVSRTPALTCRPWPPS
jgi:hypothetical protein